jgi:predicted dehydrogenase
MEDRKKTLKAAVIGTKWGQNHMQGFVESEACDLSAICSRSKNPRSLRMSELFRVSLYTDYKTMLREVKPDIVSIAVPEAAHAEIAVDALRAGSHVYCEKVMADSNQSAQKMIEAARTKGKLLNIGYNYRYSPSCMYLSKVAQNGDIGELLVAQLRAFCLCLHHMTDYAVSLLGQAERVVALVNEKPLPGRPHPYGKEGVFPTFLYSALTLKAFTIEFKNGAVLQAGSTDYSNIEEPAAFMSIMGSKGRVELDDLTGNVRVWRGGRVSEQFTPSQIRDRIGLRENCIEAVKDFANAVSEGKQAPIPGEVGLKMILLEEAILRSARSGKWEVIE